MIPLVKYLFAPQFRVLQAKRRRRIAEAELEASKDEAEALSIQSQRDEIERDSFESLLHDDKHGDIHTHTK